MSEHNHSDSLQSKIERSSIGLLLALMVLLSIGGLVEIVPLFYLTETMEHNKYPEIVWQRKPGQMLADWGLDAKGLLEAIRNKLSQGKNKLT